MTPFEVAQRNAYGAWLVETLLDIPANVTPVGVKDLFHVDGLPTRANSAIPPHILAGPEGPVIRAIRAHPRYAVLGKTTTDAFAYAVPPPTRNPRDPTRTPGGSSAGSAAAVAAGEVPVAIGTHTSRSIIAPAAFCGVVGMKTSHGRVSLDGILLMSPSMDCPGALGVSVAEVAQLLEVIVPDWIPSTHEGPIRLRSIGGFYGDIIDPERVFRTLAEEWGAIEFEPAWPREDADAVFIDCMDLLHGEMARVHAPWADRSQRLRRAHLARHREGQGDRRCTPLRFTQVTNRHCVPSS